MNADELRRKLEYIQDQCPTWGHGDAILDEAFADLFLHFEMCPFSTGELPDEFIEHTEEEE